MLIFLSDGKPVNIVLHNLPIACALLHSGIKNLELNDTINTYERTSTHTNMLWSLRTDMGRHQKLAETPSPVVQIAIGSSLNAAWRQYPMHRVAALNSLEKLL
jgi:hypothetical protein